MHRSADIAGDRLSANRQVISSDIASPVQFVEGVVSRVQLLQERTIGIINIDQNAAMKVLAVASVVGILLARTRRALFVAEGPPVGGDN